MKNQMNQVGNGCLDGVAQFLAIAFGLFLLLGFVLIAGLGN